MEAVQIQRYERALGLFRQAHTLCPAHQTLWNIVLCSRALGKKADEHRELVAYLAEPAKLSPGRKAHAAERLREIEEELACLEFVVNVPDAWVLLDGVEVPRSECTEPGRHVVRAAAHGRRDVEVTLLLRAGDRVMVPLSLPSAP